MNVSAKFRGSGLPKVYLCSDCDHDWFHVLLQLNYWDACDELLEDEPDLPIQDYFCRAVFVGKCLQCGTMKHYPGYGPVINRWGICPHVG